MSDSLVAHNMRKEVSMNQKANVQFESIYALLVRSEEKRRNVLEVVLYSMFLISVVVGIWQFAQTPVGISEPGIEPCVACHTSTTQLPTKT